MNNTAKSFGIVTVFSIATRFVSFIFKMWVSRALGAEVVGQYQIALSVLLMLFTITAGAPVVLSRKVAEASINGDIKRQNALTCASIILGLVPSIVICAVFFALGDKISPLFSNPDCVPIFFVMLPSLVTSTLYASLRSWFWGRKRFFAFSSTELIDEIVRIILSLIFTSGIISALSGAKAIALAMTISDCVCVIILLIAYFASGGRITKPQGFKELAVRTIPLSATRIISSLGASLTAFAIPHILVSTGMTLQEATAEYGRVSGMALPLIMAPVTFISALSVVLTPDIAGLKSKGDMDALREKLSSSLSFAMLVASFFFVIYLPLGKNLGALLFGDEKAGEFVSYCSVILFPIALAQATTPMVNSLGKERYTLIFSLLGSIAMLPCIFFLPKVLGVYSMAVASGLCFSVIAICNLVVLKKEVGAFANFRKAFILVGLSVILALTGTFSATPLTKYAGNLTSIIVTGVYLVFFFFLATNAFDIVDIVAYVKAFKPKTFSHKQTNLKHRTKPKHQTKSKCQSNQKRHAKQHAKHTPETIA